MDELLNTQTASEFLATALPQEGDRAYWSHFLINNRRNDREPLYRINFTRIGKGAFYAPNQLRQFIEFQKSKRLGTLKLTGQGAEVMRAFGIGEQGGGATGRKFEYQLEAQVDAATGEHFARLVIHDPLMVFRLEAAQVQALAREFVDMDKVIKRQGSDI